MPHLKDVRNALFIAHSRGVLTDAELFLLLEEDSSKNPPFSYDKYPRFSIDRIEEPECKTKKRTCHGLLMPFNYLKPSAVIRGPQQISWKGFVFCWDVCRSLASIAMWYDMIWYDMIRSTCTRVKYGCKHSDSLHPRCSWPQTVTVESWFIEPTLSRHRCHIK